MIILRILGIALVLLGLLFCITIIGAHVGLVMILLGALLAFVGKKRPPIIVQAQKDRDGG